MSPRAKTGKAATVECPLCRRASTRALIPVSRMLARATGVNLAGDAVCKACRQPLPHGDAVCRTCHGLIALVPAVAAVEPRVKDVIADACQVWRRYRNDPRSTREYHRIHTYYDFKNRVSWLVGWDRQRRGDGYPPTLPPKAFDIVMDVIIAVLPPDEVDVGDDDS